MNPIRKIACYLILVLLLNCVVQGEMIWLEELLEAQWAAVYPYLTEKGLEEYEKAVAAM